ncbi:MAG: DUF2201 family putative metallopeptidase [Jhaorihella sp.]
MHERYKQAKAILVMRHPFFATVLMNLNEKVADPNGPFQTMATDGKTIWVNENFVDKLTLDHVIGVILHEICHVIFMHPLRMAEHAATTGGLSKAWAELWNIATDYAINLQLEKHEGVSLPKPHLYDEQFDGLTAEEIFDRLLQNGGDNGSVIGDVIPPTKDDGSPATSADIETMKVDLTSLILQSADVAKQMGSMPGMFEELIKSLTEPKARWQDILWAHISKGQEFGFDWNRPNRRHRDIILPSYGAKGMPSLNCIIDTSGSVGPNALKQFLSEVNAATEAFNIEDVLLVQCDTGVRDVHQGSVLDGVILPPIKGRGGTNMNPAFDYLRDQRPAPTILFSDMEIPPVLPFPHPTVFCRHGHGAFPDWGTHVDVT